MLGVFINSGFTPMGAVLAVSTVDSFVYGFVLQEQQHIATAEQPANDNLADLPEDELRHLRSVARAAVAGTQPADDDAFVYGPDIVRRGLGA